MRHSTKRFFSAIYYECADEVLPVLCDSLRNIDPDMENRHMNQVHAMRSGVGNKHVFPRNVLLWNRDYHSQMKTLGIKRGVAWGMLCYRYCSLGQFVQLLQTQQIDTCLTRENIVQTERTKSDFTKDPNSLIKQQKVYVCKNKVRNLLTPNHFICYGSSNYFEKLTWKIFNDLSCNNSNKTTVLIDIFAILSFFCTVLWTSIVFIPSSISFSNLRQWTKFFGIKLSFHDRLTILGSSVLILGW